jgi:hypothetical protein
MRPGPMTMDTGSFKLQATGYRVPGTKDPITQGVRHNVARQFVAGKSRKLQASGCRLQAIQKFFYVRKFLVQWFQLQATGYKLPDSFSFIKFWDVKRGIKNQDKCILRMAYMEANLVWRKFNFVALCNFEF